MAKWWILIKERFSPGSYIPMILLFTAANALYLSYEVQSPWQWGRFVGVFILMLSFFFRMRLFDEIKDYEVDLKVNPTRPLARGVLTVPQVKVALLFLIIFELILASTFGSAAFFIHAAAIGYSLLMYEEFFIGDILRPHLTTYAVTHTFVSTLLGLSSAMAMSGNTWSQLSSKHFAFFLMNWLFFNLFEFARKTFAPDEERPHVPSYSNIFSCAGAWFLSMSQGLMGVGILYWITENPLSFIPLIFYFLVSLYYLIQRSRKSAGVFRAISGVYLLLHYALTIYILGA